MSHAIVPAEPAVPLESLVPFETVGPRRAVPEAPPRRATAARVVAALASVVVSLALTSAVVDGMVYADGPAAVSPSPSSA